MTCVRQRAGGGERRDETREQEGVTIKLEHAADGQNGVCVYGDALRRGRLVMSWAILRERGDLAQPTPSLQNGA